MSDVITLAGAIGLFLMFGFAVNHFSESVYWWITDRRAQKEDEKMLEDQEKTAENREFVPFTYFLLVFESVPRNDISVVNSPT